VGFFVLVSVDAVDGGAGLDGGAVGEAFAFVLLQAAAGLVELGAEGEVLGVEVLELLPEGAEVGVVGLLFECFQLSAEVCLFEFGLVDLFGDVFVALFSGAFLFREVEFVLAEGEVVVVVGAFVLAVIAAVEEVVEVLALGGVAVFVVHGLTILIYKL
jgi:hypothetical protein